MTIEMRPQLACRTEGRADLPKRWLDTESNHRERRGARRSELTEPETQISASVTLPGRLSAFLSAAPPGQYRYHGNQ